MLNSYVFPVGPYKRLHYDLCHTPVATCMGMVFDYSDEQESSYIK